MATCLLKRVKANTNYFYLEAVDGICEITFNANYSDDSSLLPDIYYSTDKFNWTKCTFTNTGLYSRFKSNYIRLEQNKKCYFKGDNPTFSGESNKHLYIATDYKNSKIKAGGNIMSLIDTAMKRKNVPDYCFYHLFDRFKNLIAPPDLPAAEVGVCSYAYLFYNCVNLTLPNNFKLPATKIDEYCYTGMFEGCESIVLPQNFILPATTLADHCYSDMFYGCLSIKHINKNILPAIITAPSCYYSMFKESGLRAPCNLPAIILADDCYKSMFKETYLKVSATKTAEYTVEWRIPSTGTATVLSDNWSYDMLYYTDGSFDDDPEANTTYYIDPQE